MSLDHARSVFESDRPGRYRLTADNRIVLHPDHLTMLLDPDSPADITPALWNDTIATIPDRDVEDCHAH